jgi:dTDP-4-dehydrorhamnose reductase
MPLYDSILITGGSGMLAQALARALRQRSKSATAVSHRDLDITNTSAVEELFLNYRPTLLINCAAYTKVDKCEEEPDLADAVNGHAVGTLAKLAERHKAKLVHYSTDFVFDGTSDRPYMPLDRPNPQSAYGRSKLLGEKLATQHAPDSLIIRTAWLYGPGGPCFPRTMVELARAKRPLNVVDDQIGSPSFTYDLAEATLRLLDSENARGLFHVANHGSTSWFAFTQAILEEFHETTQLAPISSADWKKTKPSSAMRPKYSVLDVSAYEATTGHRMRPWRQALRDYRLQVADHGF